MIVTLEGELKIALPSLAGIYVRQSNGEHNFSHWLQDPGTNAIWYDRKLGGWNFGSQEYLGSTKTYIYTEDDVPGPQIATNWNYDDGRQIESDDILVDAIGRYIHNKIIDKLSFFKFVSSLGRRTLKI